MNQPRRTRSAVLIVTSGFLLQQIIAFATGVVVARAIGASEFGAMSVLRNIVTFLLTLTPLGLDLALLKHAAFYDHRPGAFRAQIFRLRFLTAGINIAIVALVLFGGGTWLQTHVYHFANFSGLLLITVIGLPFAADLAVMGAVYRADHRPGAYALMTNYVQPFVRLGGAVLLLHLGWSTKGVMIANTAAYGLSSLLVAAHRYALRHAHGGDAIAEAEGWSGAWNILRDSLWMAVSLFVGGAMRSVDILTLGMFVASREVGSYGALSAVAQLVQAYPFAASQTLGPTVARCYRDGDMASLRHALGRYLRSASMVGGFLFGGIAAMGDHLDLLFGHSFHFRFAIACMLPLGWLVSATLGPMGYCLSMTGRHRFELGILVTGLVGLVIGCAVLVPRYGQLGAASAVVLAFSTINLIRFAYASRIFGFIPGSYTDFLPPVIAFAIAYATISAVDAVLGRSLMPFLLACVLYAVFNGSVAYRLYLEPEERAALRRRISLMIPVLKRA